MDEDPRHCHLILTSVIARGCHRCYRRYAFEGSRRVPEGSLASESARCMRKLGDHQEARRQSERVIALRSTEHTRIRAFGQLGLVAAHLAHGEPEEACAVALAVFDATESLSSYLVVQQFLQLSRLLKPYRDIAAITEFLDCLEVALPQRLLAYQWLDQTQPASATAPRTYL
jgi:hypothetical protein